ncbi:hypothetical protein [Streptosporangium sp. NPDC001681]|uniref:hypothetical protein n=1 Tax=Streptosporangium sp. NPDC001681 TaxID=3154395 RepID=UPI0033286845
MIRQVHSASHGVHGGCRVHAEPPLDHRYRRPWSAVPALLTCQHLHGGTGLDIDHPLHRYVTGGLALGQFLGGTEACLDAAAGSARVS